MKRQQPKTCRIFFDAGGSVVRWVCGNLGENTRWVGQNISLGIELEKKLIAGIIINDIRPYVDAWLTIYAQNKKWCNRRVLRTVFEVVFNLLKCRRASVMVDADNIQSQNLVSRLGFVQEGVLRAYQNNGHDALVYSMLTNECRWRTTKNE
ncbi:MAG: GNAT family N-acetyltransferase [Alphaproteobacteria bacterium]|nr:GNAT family N-acetyltransferase [Alphaproteobacteria bacterium]